MNRTTRTLALAALGLALTGTPALAQAYQQPMNYAPPKKNHLIVVGGMFFPAWGYQSYLDDIGWTARASFTIEPRRGTHIRIEGEYNNIGFEGGLSGSAALYGGGIGGGRSMTQGSTTFQGYLVLGAYNIGYQVNNAEANETQFGTKFGFDVISGRGRVQPVFSAAILYTWGSPTASIIPITLGLRF